MTPVSESKRRPGSPSSVPGSAARLLNFIQHFRDGPNSGDLCFSV